MRYTIIILGLFTLLLVCGCGGGGGGDIEVSNKPKPIVVTANNLVVRGEAGWPGATALSVTIDGKAATVTEGKWTHTIDLTDAAVAAAGTKMLRVAVIADDITVAVREVMVSW
jgi:hypothetical protein